MWIEGGKEGKGIVQEDVEALVKYTWSPQQTLYMSPLGKGGFNYAGTAHPEYFNRQYFAQSLYPDNTPSEQRRNEWYGSTTLSEDDAGGDGRHLLISWTAQLQGGTDNGIYQIWLAKVEFDIISEQLSGISTSVPTTPTATTSNGQQPSKTPENMMPNVGSKVSPIFGVGERKERCLSDTLRSLVLLCSVLGGIAVLL